MWWSLLEEALSQVENSDLYERMPWRCASDLRSSGGDVFCARRGGAAGWWRGASAHKSTASSRMRL